ncbi:hypothetical protein C0989_001159 [Termitomyces sp. Mn162]|nr:hypothetical protein C0989_001159 [Termitomyces sp. Mn162]
MAVVPSLHQSVQPTKVSQPSISCHLALEMLQTATAQSPPSAAEGIPPMRVPDTPLSLQPATNLFIFPPVFDSTHSHLLSPEQEPEEHWSGLLASLKKCPSAPVAETPKQKKQKTAIHATKPAPCIQKAPGMREVVPLTVNANGKPLYKTHKPALCKKVKGKENMW